MQDCSCLNKWASERIRDKSSESEIKCRRSDRDDFFPVDSGIKAHSPAVNAKGLQAGSKDLMVAS